VRTSAENKHAVTAFFNGTTIDWEGPDGVKTFKLEGYEEMLDRPCFTDSAGKVHIYRDHPERMGNHDETYMAPSGKSKGCAPVAGRINSCQGGGTEAGVTVLSGCTFTGHHWPDVFVFEGKTAARNPLEFASPGCKAFARPDGYMMTWEVYSLVLEELAQNVPGARRGGCVKSCASRVALTPLARAGGVSPTHRFLLLVDGHASRLNADCIAKAQALGFDILVFPGGMTALLQLMDQLFGTMKADYTQRVAMEKVTSGGRVLSLARRIGTWCKMKKAFVEVCGADAAVAAVAKLGIYPPSLPKALENLAARTKDDRTAAAVGDGDVSMLSAQSQRIGGLKRRRVSDITAAFAAAGSDTDSEGEGAEEEQETAAPAKKSRRCNYPAALFSGSGFDQLLAAKMTAGLAEAAAKTAKRAERAASAAKNKAERLATAARAAEKRQARAAATAAKAAAAAARAAAKAAPPAAASAPAARKKR
jgi:hypothetical protein